MKRSEYATAFIAEALATFHGILMEDEFELRDHEGDPYLVYVVLGTVKYWSEMKGGNGDDHTAALVDHFVLKVDDVKGYTLVEYQSQTEARHGFLGDHDLQRIA